ncbi:MAG: esterase-like activity of phytase family protein [Proteobacteria bacterium]|nr:esterase-like activity of phytase family protein [Pseudomonadota bacterium]
MRARVEACPRRLGRALLAALLAVCAGAADSARAEPVTLTARPVALNPRDPTQATVGFLTYRGGIEIASPDSRFGGLSGLVVTPSGDLISVSDRGFWLIARLVLDERGYLVGITDGEMGRLGGPGGLPVGRRQQDAEDIALLPDGTAIVSFEHDHRLWRYYPSAIPFQGQVEPVPPPPGIDRLPANGGIEALAALSDGRILAVVEGLSAPTGGRLGWVRLPSGAWEELSYVPAPDFLPSGGAGLANGDALVLERRFIDPFTYEARLTRVPGPEIKAGARLSGRELARLSRPLSLDNFEGVAVRPGPTGETLVYIISDDNYLPIQRTLLLQFVLRE